VEIFTEKSDGFSESGAIIVSGVHIAGFSIADLGMFYA
jgi:hypothetical protein